MPQVQNVGMRGYVGVTDDEWYRFLADRPEVSSEARQLFGEANGTATLEQMRARIAHYRREPIGPHDDPEIGCVFVRDVTFFPESMSYDPPPGFASNIVQGKGYDMADRHVAGYFGDLMQLVLGRAVEIDFSQPWHHRGPVFGDPRLTPYRLAQRSFQAVVLRPVANGGENRLDNGLLLRSDVPTMFDRGYVGVDPSHRLVVSPRLRDEFGNGEQFYSKAGQVIALPDRKVDRPHREFLEWHLDTVFKAS